jgi:hypothetical protein
MAHGRRLDPRTNRVPDHGSQQQRGQTYDQRRGDRSKPPSSPAGSKRKHRLKDATAGSRRLAGVESQTASIKSASIGPFGSLIASGEILKLAASEFQSSIAPKPRLLFNP